MLYLIGAGPGSPEYLTEKAAETIKKAESIIAFGRIGETVKKINPSVTGVNTLKEIKENADSLLKENKGVYIAASGDPGFYGILDYLKRTYSEKIEVIPGISSMQYMASKLRLPWYDMTFISVHGRDWNEEMMDSIKEKKKVFFLTDSKNTPENISERLKDAGLKGKLYAGYNLSYEDEVIEEGNPGELKDRENTVSSVIFIAEEENEESKKDGVGTNPEENQEIMKNTPEEPGIYNQSFTDAQFIREKVPMTKYEVRILTLEKLGVREGTVFKEVGSGTGSVTLEAVNRGARVTSCESKKEAYDLTLKNLNNLFPDLKPDEDSNVNSFCTPLIIEGKAPQCFGEPEGITDAFFIGGSGGNLREITQYALSDLKPRGRIAANFVTLDNAYTFKKALKEFSFDDIEVSVISVSREDHIEIMRAENPVYIISAVKPGNKTKE